MFFRQKLRRRDAMTKSLSRRIAALVEAILVSLIVLLTNVSALAQKEAHNWFFGNGAGLNFSSGIPVAVPVPPGGLPMSASKGEDAPEGSAVMSNRDGGLLFYTNGRTIWNKEHQPMPNANKSLWGERSATQSAIIVPWPGTNCKKYFVFTLNVGGNGERGQPALYYSVVNMDLAGGLGDVDVTIAQNVILDKPLNEPMAEKLAAVSDASGTGFWVITHGFTATMNNIVNKKFYAYHITATGIDTNPVVSIAGSAHESLTQFGFPKLGQMKVSPDGKLIACAVNQSPGFVEILNFSTASGIVSDPATRLDGPPPSGGTTFVPYGIEFSPNSRLLYVSTMSPSNSERLYQFNLLTKEWTQLYAEQGSAKYDTGALQLGPDKKIYLARDWKPYLSVIEYPDTPGEACKFTDAGPQLPPGGASTLGLPAIITGSSSCTGIQPTTACCQCMNLDAVAGVPVRKGGDIYSLKPTLKAAPEKVTRVTATIISMTQTFPTASCRISGPLTSYLANASSPKGFNSYQPAAPGNEVIWSAANSEGVDISDGRDFPFDIKLPPRPSPLRFTTNLLACSDSVNFCVKYTFTDINCRTCEIIRCYTVTNRLFNEVRPGSTLDPSKFQPRHLLRFVEPFALRPVVNKSFPSPLRVAVADDADRVITDARGKVQLSIKPGTGAPGAHLDGLTTVEMVNGEATFNNLSIDKAGHGYVLIASGCDFPDSVETQTFDVLPAQDESRSYRLERGMNEFGVWGGSSFNTPSPTGAMSHARLDTVGFRYGRILATSTDLALEYTFEAFPWVRTSYTDFALSPFGREESLFFVDKNRQTVSGVGLFPVGAQIYLRRQSRLNPFISGGTGFIRFENPVPRFRDPRLAETFNSEDVFFFSGRRLQVFESPPHLNDQRFSYAYNLGGGLQYSVRPQHKLTVGYKRFYFSSVDHVPNSDGFTSNYFYTGYSFFK
jgi:hypothetical protein